MIHSLQYPTVPRNSLIWQGVLGSGICNIVSFMAWVNHLCPCLILFSLVRGSRGSLNSLPAFIPTKRIWASSLWFFRFSLTLCSLSSFLILSANSLSSHRICSSLSSGVSLLLNTLSAAFSKSCIVCSPNPSIFCYPLQFVTSFSV